MEKDLLKTSFQDWLKEFEAGKRHLIGKPIRELPERCARKNDAELARILNFQGRKRSEINDRHNQRGINE